MGRLDKVLALDPIVGLYHYIRTQDYSRYGIDSEEYIRLLERQDYKCAVCSVRMDMAIDGRLLCVDHEHDTGRVRGLLCSKCNTGIGLLGDDLKCVLRAAQYLAN